jgi:lipopolysaccharide export system permease protein
MRILDRYVIRQFTRIFLICVLGVPFLFIVIDLTDRLDTYLAESVQGGNVTLHYIYQFPYQTLLAFPIAGLLAAVFTISSMTRHFEITAAKAGGISFYRLVAPLLILGAVASLVALVLTEVVPITNRRSREALGDEIARTRESRNSFVFRGNEGRYYTIRRLDAPDGRITDIRIDREGTGYPYPTYTVSAPAARWDSAAGLWVLEDGRIRFFPEPTTTLTFRFAELWQAPFSETPAELLAEPKEPEEMGYAELGRYIEAIERSGGRARKLKVERMLKISFPLTVFIIVLFGAPLANTTRKGGAAFSIGIALATTIIFLTLIRIAQAMGAGGVIAPEAAAWLPNAIFLVAGLVMMKRVQT